MIRGDRQSREQGALLAARSAIELKRVKQQVREFENSAVCALSMLLDLKDLPTGLHATRLAEWAVRVGEQLGLSPPELRDLENASLLHDIGKVGVPEAVLNKRGRLSPEEYELVKKHAEYGWAILRAIPPLTNASLLVLHHHERMDGRGYPGGLRGHDIPLGARVVAVVDAFDAMLATRSYRNALPLGEAVCRLRDGAGAQFDQRIVELFIGMADQVGEVGSVTPSAA